MFPDADTARGYMEKRRWPDGPVCPACGEKERIYDKGKGYYRCNADLLVFTIRTGTIFERSKLELHKWLYAMYLFVTARKGISSVQLAKQIGVTQKSAWFVLQRLRAACGDDPTQLAGIIEMDDKIREIMGRVTDAVFKYQPPDKGKAVKTVKRQRSKRANCKSIGESLLPRDAESASRQEQFYPLE